MPTVDCQVATPRLAAYEYGFLLKILFSQEHPDEGDLQKDSQESALHSVSSGMRPAFCLIPAAALYQCTWRGAQLG